jgi:two-component system cell cycle response regulator
VRQHAVLGERILSSVPSLRGVARIVRCTHERWDGSGYPDSLAGERIPLASRVIAACDAYAAMCSDRAYRPTRHSGEALAELRRESGRQFDPAVVAALLTELRGDDERAGAREESRLRAMRDALLSPNRAGT